MTPSLYWSQSLRSRRLYFNIIIYTSLTSLYIYGLLFSYGALNISIPSENLPLSTSMKSRKPLIEVPRSLPHLRVVNTLYRYEEREQSIDAKNEINTTPKNYEDNVVSTKSNQSNKHVQPPDLDVMRPLLMLLAYTLMCRLVLAILIYRNSNRSVESNLNGDGLMRHIRDRSFWEIFRTIPIRTRRGPGAVISRHDRFLERLNQQRVANGSRPLNMQTLLVLASNREFSGLDYDSLLEVEEQNVTIISVRQGATEEEINRCPLRILQYGDDLITTSRSQDTIVDGTSCAICLESYAVDDMVRTLPCFHTYHTKCIDTWLRQKATCAICKHRVTSG